MKVRDKIAVRSVAIIVMAFTLSAAKAETDERQAVIQAMQSWERAVEQGDYAALENLYMEDAIYYPHQAEPLVGREAIMESNRRRGARSKVDIVQEVDDVKINGSWAIYSCTAKVIATSQADGSESARHVRVLLVMEKDTDGQWKVLRDIDNTPPGH